MRGRLAAQLPRVNVVIMPYATPLHAIPEGRLPPEGVVTCLRVLRFQEGPLAHVVKNVLIDYAAIERTVGLGGGRGQGTVAAWPVVSSAMLGLVLGGAPLLCPAEPAPVCCRC